MTVGWQEYEGLTNKIHDLQMREQQLHEVLFDYQHPAPAAPADDSMLMMGDSSGMQSPGAVDMPPTSTLQDEDTTASGKVPMRGIVRAYLPKKMTTVVSLCTYSLPSHHVPVLLYSNWGPQCPRINAENSASHFVNFCGSPRQITVNSARGSQMKVNKVFFSKYRVYCYLNCKCHVA